MLRVLGVPKVQLAITLVIISLFVLVTSPGTQSFMLIAGSLTATAVFDLLFTYVRRRKFFMPWAAVVTGLIIGLIIDPSANFLQILIISAIAMAVKNFIRVGNRHIFNPASSGLVLGGIIFSMPVAWWGVTSQNINQLNPINLLALLIILLPSYVSAIKLKRYGSILAFLVVYILVQLFQNPSVNLNSLVGLVLNPSVLFFSLVMLPEPMTSPVKLSRQLMYGGLVAVMVTVLSLVFLNYEVTAQIFSVDPLLISLLLCNLLFFRYR